LHDNAPAHRALATQKKMAYLGFQCFDYPPYSLDMAPSDYHLIPGLKKQLKSHHFLSNMKVIAVVETWLDGQPSEFFLWLKKHRWKNHVNCAVSNHEYKVALNSARQSYSTWLLAVPQLIKKDYHHLYTSDGKLY
jgi:hypothetical protein